MTSSRTPESYGVEGLRLRALADELNAIETRLRAIADEVAYRPEYAARLPREFRGLYEVKRATKKLESAAVEVGSVVSELRGGARVIHPYDDAVEPK